MSYIIKLMFGLFLSLNVYGQSPSLFCKHIPRQDSILLHNFFETVRNAINTKDKKALSLLCNFPLSYSPGRSQIAEDYPTQNITQKAFTKGKYEIFLDPLLIDGTNKCAKNMENIFIPIFDDQCHFTDVTMQYDIGANSEKRCLFYLKKINGSYKIMAFEILL